MRLDKTGRIVTPVKYVMICMIKKIIEEKKYMQSCLIITRQHLSIGSKSQ